MFKFSSLFTFLFCALIFPAFGQGLKFETPWLEGFHPLDEEPYASSAFTSDNPVILKMELKGGVFKDTAIVDFEKRQITFRRYDAFGFRLWEYHYKELSDYLLARRNYALMKGWQSGISVSRNDAAKSKSSVMKFQWEMPVHYPSWAQRVIGTDPPRLTINGSLTITMGFDNSTYLEASTDKDESNSTGFDFQVDYQFSISGSIGRLISVNISADNQNEFAISDVFKNFKIHYKESQPGELEDEIIQEVEAGWTGFQMPGTELSGYSESNEGLFGIKVRSQLGPLSLTSVISHERGEAVKSTFSPDQGGDERVITEEDYVVNKFFFLDNKYRRFYNLKYGKNAPANPTAPPKVDTLIVWRSIKAGENLLLDTVTLGKDPQPLAFIRLYRDRHYFLNETEGWIRFADTPDISNSFVAIYMRTSNPDYNKGTITKMTAGDTTWNLWVLKPKDPTDSASADQDTSRFHLMWRNVYDLDSSDWANFKFRIVQKTIDDENEREENENSQKFSDILGISTDGKMSLDKPYIFDKNNGYLVIPPWDTSFYGNEPFRNPALGKYQDSIIYKSSKEVLHRSNYTPFYKIYTVSAAKQTTFNLGWDVMEGEIVKAGGITLKRNIDYIIDYSSGELQLVSPDAKNADKITVEYQRSAMFVPEKKVFFGTRGELKLPFISDKSFAGLSFLYQNVKVNEEIPQLEQEPYNKGLLDFNIRIDLTPEWMTNLINKIPLINTNAESKMIFDVEYARSFMNPNPEGKAYVDDFEDSKQNNSLPITSNGWYQASPPFFDSLLIPDSLHRYPPAWDFYWFTPREEDEYRVRILDVKDINQNTATTNANDYETVLRLHCTPSPGGEYNQRYANTWAGIMTPVYIKDKTEDQYFEFIVKAADDFKGQGKLLFQMGTVREDLSVHGGPPNKIEDTEDPAIITDPGTYDSDRDNGFDTTSVDSLEYYLIPGEGHPWDTLRLGDPLLGPDSLDPGRDLFKKYEDRKDGDVKNRRVANRREKDWKLTSEDINSDYLVYTHKAESYFQYTIDLENDTLPFIDKNANVKYGNGWRKYRIPLKEVIKDYDIRDSVGNPSWKNIEFIRLIWNGFSSSSLNQEHQLIFDEMQFTGSQWLPLYDSVGTKIEASAITNKEDNFYRSQVTNEPLVLVEKDENDDEEQESSLRLNFKNIKPGDTALVTKSYNYHQLDISSYRYLSLALYGRNPDGSTAKGIPLYNNKVHFVFRFGSDDSTYYEYKSDIYSGWQEVKIDLRRIAEIKDSFMINNSDTVPIDAPPSQYGKAFLRVVSKASGRQPNFSRIQWVGIGVIRDEDDVTLDNSAGEIWVNEMKVSGIEKLNGRAIRANISTQWADFINLSGSLVFTDGDFRKMTDNTIKRQNSSLSTSMSSSMNLNKFLPQDWGISLPVGASYNSSVTRPQLKSNSDVVLTDKNGKSDGLLELIADKDSPSRHYQQKSTSISSYISFDKTKNNDNPLLNLTADRVSGGFKFNTSNSVNRQGPSRVQGIDYKIISESQTYSGNLKYDLTPDDPPSWTSWHPFESKGPSKLREYQFSLLPENFQIDLIDANQGKVSNSDTKRNTFSTKHNFDIKHGVNFQYAPISPLLDFNYTLNISRDLQKYADEGASEMVDNVFSFYKGNSAFARHYYILEGEKYRTQSAKVNLEPKIFDWLSTTADYSTNYQGNVVNYRYDSTGYISASVNNTFSFDASLNFDVALKNLVDATSKTRLAKFFASVDSFFNAVKLTSVSFNYTANQELVNNYMNKDIIGSGLDFLKYQLGMKGKDLRSFLSGDMDDDFLGGMRYRKLKNDNLDFYREDKRSTDQKYSISSGLSLSIPFQLSISPVSLSWSRTFDVIPDTTYYDTTVTFPDFSLGLRTSALSKAPIIKDLLQSLEINSSLNFKRSYRRKNALDPDTTREFGMSPLIGIQGVVKRWPINFSYRSKISRSMSWTKKDTTSQISSGGHELDISYRIERNSRLSEINLLRWKIPVRGKTTMGLTGSRDVMKESINNGTSERNEVSYSIKPYLSYIFTDNITGNFEYTQGKVKRDERVTKTRKLALIASIQFN